MKKWLQSKDRKPITLKNIGNFFVAWFRYLFTNYGWKKEQTEWRRKKIQVTSPECLTKGFCKHCKCDFPEKLYENDECELGCYPKWMNKKKWLEFKNTEEWKK